MGASLADNVRYAEAVCRETSKLIQGMPLPSNPRFNLLHAYVAVEIEHQKAIFELVRLCDFTGQLLHCFGRNSKPSFALFG